MTVIDHELCTSRCDQLDGDPKEVSPIFTQFLECVWQLSEQFPQVCRSYFRSVLCLHRSVHMCQRGICQCLYYFIINLSLGFWVQRVVPAADPWTRPLLPIWKLPWQQSEAEGGLAVSPVCICRAIYKAIADCKIVNCLSYNERKLSRFALWYVFKSEHTQIDNANYCWAHHLWKSSGFKILGVFHNRTTHIHINLTPSEI